MSITEALELQQSNWQLRKLAVATILLRPPSSPPSCAENGSSNSSSSGSGSNSNRTSKMLDYTNFHAVFPPHGAFPYNIKENQEIETLRKSFGGVLFYDRVLASLRIHAGKTCNHDHCFNHYICTAGRVYPPKDEQGLRGLHRQICESKVGVHHKLSVFYYLLLDYDLVRGHTSQVADQFVANSSLPRKYHLMMHGLWHMDRKEFKYALEYLTHPSLPSEFGDEILTVLIRHSQGDDSDFSLPLAYYHTVSPVLHTSEALHLLFTALAQTSVTEALYFSRKYPAAARRPLFERLVAGVLEGHADADRLKELVGLPLDGTEEGWFAEYLGDGGEGRKLKLASAAVETRLIVTGRHRGQIRVRGLEGEGNPLKRSQRVGR